MKKRIVYILFVLCMTLLVACGNSSVSEDDAPEKNENATELAQEDNQSEKDTEHFNEPAAEGEGPEKLPTPEVSDWGIALTAKDVTPEGMTIVCTQSGGLLTGELNTGSFYVLEREVQGVWCMVEYTEEAKSKNIGWTAEAWIIPMNDAIEWEVDWEWLYGSLAPGHYRIGKEIMNFRETGNYDKEMYYAEFEIEE